MAVPSIIATSSSTNLSGYPASKAFDGSATAESWWVSNAVGTGQSLTAQFASAFVCVAYKITSHDTSSPNQVPQAWDFQGSNNGTSWTTLDSRTGITYWTLASTLEFAVNNSTAYSYYRLANMSSGTTYVVVAELGFRASDESGILAAEAKSWLAGPPPFLPRRAFDGTAVSPSHWVANTASSEWLLWRYGVARTATAYHITNHNDGTAAANLGPGSWTFQGSNDGSTWTTLDTRTGQTWARGETKDYTVTGAGSYAWYRLNAVASSGGSFIAIAELTVDGTGALTGTVAGSSPVGVGAIVGTVPTTGSVAGTSPSGVGAVVGTAPTTGTVAGTSPVGVGSFTGTTDTSIHGTIAGTSPSGVGAIVGVVPTTGTIAGASPSGVGSLVGTIPAPIAGTLAGASPSGVGALAGVVTLPGAVTGTLSGSSPRAEGSISGLVGDPTIERATVSLTHTPVGIVSVIPLVPSTELDHAVPVTRTSILAPVLSAEYPAHPAQGETGAPVIIDGDIGFLHLWVRGQDVTYLRGGMSIIRRWESESPFGDTVAACEFPQLSPWDAPGSGDLGFLHKDATVAIGIVSETESGRRTRRLWSGFLDARGNGLGDGEDYSWEAKGTLWQAASQVREPLALTEPVDIGVQIARTLNAVEGRRWRAMPLTPIGITTLTRGSRDETFWDYVQALLSEAITDDGRQWTLSHLSPGIIRLALKPAPSTVHATVSYGTPGVDIDLRVDESTRVDRIFMRGIGPKMGGWANVFYPGIELLAVPPYPMASLGDYMGLGTRDSDTTSGTGVTDWQRRVSEIKSFANPKVSGVMSAAWIAVVDDVQRFVGVTADSSLGPQTWNATFDRAILGIDMRPVRLPLASKVSANKYLYSAAGVKLGLNPAYDGTLIVRDVAIDVGPGKTKAQGRKLARKLLGIYGNAAASGQIVWTTDPNETTRTHLSHLSNIKVKGFEGGDRIVQVASKSVELEASDDGPVYVVTTRVDERARDAMAVEDLLEQRRSAQPDPSKRPGNPARASRQVSDQRTPWDSESPCGVLRRTAVNGASGLWTVVTVPFAEVGQLAGIRLKSTRPFYFALFASQRITENKLAAWVGNPSTQDDPWRDAKHHLDDYGIIEAWGEKGNACGYSPKTQADGGSFTGDFILDTPVDYWTETVPYVSVAIFMSDGSGWIEGEFIPAYET